MSPRRRAVASTVVRKGPSNILEGTDSERALEIFGFFAWADYEYTVANVIRNLCIERRSTLFWSSVEVNEHNDMGVLIPMQARQVLLPEGIEHFVPTTGLRHYL